MAQLTDEEIADLRALEKAAPPPPWRAVTDGDRCLEIDSLFSFDDAGEHRVPPRDDSAVYEHPVVETDSGVYPPDAQTGRLIAAMRNALVSLLDEVERLRHPHTRSSLRDAVYVLATEGLRDDAARIARLIDEPGLLTTDGHPK